MQNGYLDQSSLNLDNQATSAFEDLFARTPPSQGTHLVPVDNRPTSLGAEIAKAVAVQFPGARLTVEYENADTIQLRCLKPEAPTSPQFVTIQLRQDGTFTVTA